MSELPDGWADVPMIKLAGPDGMMCDGDWVETKDQDKAGKIRLTQLADVGDGVFRDRSARFINEESAKRLNVTYLRSGDILIARMPDPLGRACIFPGLPQPAVTAVDVMVTRVDGSVADPAWIVHAINSPDVRSALANEAGGTTRQRIAGGKLKAFVLPTPPVPEQRRIVAKVDRLRSRTARARSTLDRIPGLMAQYKAGLLSAACSGTLTEEWRASRGLPEPNETKIEAIVHGLRYGTSQKCSATSAGTPVLRIPNISSGRITHDDLKFAELPAKEFDKLKLSVGDILVIRSNGSPDLVGRAAVVDERSEGWAYAGYLIRLRPKLDCILPAYLAAVLESPQVRATIEVGARSTSGVNNLNATELGNLALLLPHLDEQAEIVRRIETAFEWLDRVEADYKSSLRLLPRLDAAILAKAFCGELVPQDPSDEPVATTLARVAATRIAAPAARRGRRARAN